VHSLLLSIRPEHANKIFSGSKKAELRRVKPKLSKADTVLVYVSSPVKALVGGFEVDEVIEGSPDEIWCQVEKVAGVSKDEFQKYFVGTNKAFAIMINKAWSLGAPLSLLELKEKWLNFHPPQSYRYITVEQAAALGI
jgi:predicted transcriptional regulator